MNPPRFLIALACFSASACSADTVELFPDAGLSDSGVVDAASDAAAEDSQVADSGGPRPDAGADPWDAGAPTVLLCPSAIHGELNDYGMLVREDLGMTVSAAPDWTTRVAGSTVDRSTIRYVHRHAPTGWDKQRDYSIADGEITTPPHLASFDDDRAAVVAYSSGRSPTVMTGWLVRDSQADEQSIGPVQSTNPLELLDLIHDGDDLVFAVANDEGEAWLLKRNLAGRPTGWRQLDLTPASGRVDKLRLVERDGRIWLVDLGTDGTVFEMIIEEGQRREMRFDLNCVNADIGDAAAIDADRLAYLRTCSGTGPELKLHSLLTSAIPRYLRFPSAAMRVPRQIAYDGRTLGIAAWRQEDSGPTIRFYDSELQAVSRELSVDLSDYVEVLDMDLAGAVDVNGRFSHWILGIVARKAGGAAEAVTLNFQGCWLE